MKPLEPCTGIRASFSSYLDGAVSGRTMQQIAAHLDRCPACAREFASVRGVQQILAALGPVRPPADLSRRLRLAIAREQTRSWNAVRDRLQMRWENNFRPLVLQASAGLAGAIVLLGGILFLLGIFGASPAVMANDEPLGNITAPRYLYSVTEPLPIRTAQDQTIVVEARINADGLVYDYTILSGPTDPAVRSEVAEHLLTSVFQPASVFGGPVRGRLLMTFAGVSVHG